MSFQRVCRRSWIGLRASAASAARTLQSPASWPWKRIGLGAAVVSLGAAGIAVAESRRGERLTQRRVFNEGSPLLSIESSLSTGDLLLFSRSIAAEVGGGSDATSSSLHPLRLLLVMLQKLQGRSEFDHIALVIVRNSYPYVLERSLAGGIVLRPFDARMLHSSAREIVLRRMETKLSPQQEERIEAWLEKLMGETHGTGDAATVPSSASSAASSTTLSAAASSAPRLSPTSLLRHLLFIQLFPSAATVSASSASARGSAAVDPLVTLGQITELWGEAQMIARRIEKLSSEQQPSSSQQQKKQNASAPGANSSVALQRLTVRHKEVLNRLQQLQSLLDASPPFSSAAAAAASAASASAVSASGADPDDAVLSAVSDFPSATLVARALQVLGVLPDPSAGSVELRIDQPASAASSSSSSAAIVIPASRIPPASAYAPRHFLSSSHVPLMDTAAVAANAAATRGVAGQGRSLTMTVAPVPEVFLHREMFIKTKPLPFTVEE